MALFFICHLSSVISVINNTPPERFGSVGNNAYTCRQKVFLVNGSEATSYRLQMTDTKKHSTEVRRRVALRRDLREAPEHPRSARKCPFGPSAPVTRLNSRNSPPLKGWRVVEVSPALRGVGSCKYLDV